MLFLFLEEYVNNTSGSITLLNIEYLLEPFRWAKLTNPPNRNYIKPVTRRGDCYLADNNLNTANDTHVRNGVSIEKKDKQKAKSITK